MVAAATFIHSRNLSDVTISLKDKLSHSKFSYILKQMTVYLSNKGDDLLPIVINTGASISLTTNYNDFIGPICAATITELHGLSHTTDSPTQQKFMESARKNGLSEMCLVQQGQ